MKATRFVLATAVLIAIAVGAMADEPLWLRGPALDAFEGLTLLEIKIEGNKTTRDEAVLRELSVVPGEAFRADRLRADLRFLEGLSLFLRRGLAPVSRRAASCWSSSWKSAAAPPMS